MYIFLDPKCAEEEIQVGQKMFCNMLSISKATIQTSFLKRTASGTVKQDKRGTTVSTTVQKKFGK